MAKGYVSPFESLAAGSSGKSGKGSGGYESPFSSLSSPAIRSHRKDLQTSDSLLTPIDKVKAAQKGGESIADRAKNGARDLGHAISAVGRFLGTSTSKLVNTAVSEGKQVAYTAEEMAANQTHNTEAFRHANQASENAYKNDNKDHTGLLGVGTVFKNGEEASSGKLTVGLKRIGGNTLGAAGEILPFAKGLGIGAKGAKYAVAGRDAILAERAASAAEDATKGEKAISAAISGGKRVATNAAFGVTGSAGNQLANEGKINPKQLAKDTAASVVTGEVANLGGKLTGKALDKIAERRVTGKAVVPPEVDKAINTKSVFSQLPKVAEGDTKQSVLNRNFVMGKYQEFKKSLADASNGMSEKDKKLIDKIESSVKIGPKEAAARVDRIASQADNPDQFKKVVGAIRDFNDTRFAGDVQLGRDVKYRQNYLNRTYDVGQNTAEGKALEKLRLKSGGDPGYVKGRTIATQAEADRLAALKNPDGTPQFPHLKRANANAIEDTMQAIDRASNEHGSQALMQGLEQAHPGQVSVGKIGYNPKTGEIYKGLDIAGGESVSLPKDLARQYNKRAVPEPSNKLLRGYDKANSTIKQVKLGGGLFHGFTETTSAAGQQITSGNLFKHPIENLRVIAGTFSPKQHRINVERWNGNAADHVDGLSTADRTRLAGVTTSKQALQGDTYVSGRFENIPGIKQLHDAVFGRQIPEIKTTIFEQATRGMDSRNPEDLLKMRQVARAVNNLGGINRAVDGMSPKVAKQMSRVLLATDFTEGKMRTIVNAVSKGGPEGKIARQLVVGKTIVSAIPGLVFLAANGQLNLSDPKEIGSAVINQILDPSLPTPWRGAPTASNPNGVPKAAHLPATFVSELGKIIKPMLDPMSEDKLAGAKDYASARLAALPSVGEQLGTNRDYFGNHIYGSDKNGNPIGAKQTALNVTNQVLPIPFVQGNKSIFGGQSAAESALNVAGFRVSSDATSAEAGHSRAINDFFTTKKKVGTVRTQVTHQITELLKTGNVNAARRKAAEYNASIDQRTMAFRQKYADHYNPAWDKDFNNLKIATSDSAFKTRLRDSKQAQAVLQ